MWKEDELTFCFCFLFDEALRKAEDLSCVPIHFAHVTCPTHGPYTQGLPWTSSVVQILVRIQGDDQVSAWPKYPQQRLQHLMAEILPLIDKDGIKGTKMTFSLRNPGDALLHNHVIVFVVLILIFYGFPQNLGAKLVVMGNMNSPTADT